MIAKTLLLVMTSLFLSLNAGAAVEKPRHYVLCKHRKIVRTIRVNKIRSGGCVTKYTKAGVDKVIGTGKNIPSCRKFLNNIKGNLEKAEWKCRDISSTRISKSSRKKR